MEREPNNHHVMRICAESAHANLHEIMGDRSNQNFSIMPFRTVHMRARLPKMYMGMVVKRQANWIPPMAMKTVRAPSESSQLTKKREKTRPWKISARKAPW